jgi:hypothetical protein
MGLNPAGGHEEMPQPVTDDKNAPVFWIEKNGKRCLRPSWQLPWDDNVRGWAREIALKVQTAGKNFHSGADAAELAALSLADILSTINTFFTSCRIAYNSKNKPVVQQEQR